MRPIRRLQSWWWNRLHPEFDEPDFDEVSDAARRQWIASSKHPASCKAGCQCKPEDLRGGG